MKFLSESLKSKRANSTVWGPGTRLRAPVGSRAKPLVGVQGARPRKLVVLEHFQCKILSKFVLF